MEAGAHGLSRFHGTTSHPIPLTGGIPLLLPRIRGIFQVQGLIRWIVIPEGGSAGLRASLSLKTKLTARQVRLDCSRALGIIRVGECSIVDLPNQLHGPLKLNPADFHGEGQPSSKLGVRFL